MLPYLRGKQEHPILNLLKAAVVPEHHLSFTLRITASVSIKLGSDFVSNSVEILPRRLLMPIRVIRISPQWEAMCSQVKALNMYLPVWPSHNIISSLEGEYVWIWARNSNDPYHFHSTFDVSWIEVSPCTYLRSSERDKLSPRWCHVLRAPLSLPFLLNTSLSPLCCSREREICPGSLQEVQSLRSSHSGLVNCGLNVYVLMITYTTTLSSLDPNGLSRPHMQADRCLDQ